MNALLNFIAVSLTNAIFVTSLANAASCESLSALALPNTTITIAQSVAAGAFAPPSHPWPKQPDRFAYNALPAFCRVAADIRPAKDSDIKFEVWMPLAGWNGKLQGTGNGIWSGEVWYWALGQALAAGYAAANTDTGHEGAVDDASFALGHPEKVTDFGYRAVHEMTEKSKSIIAAFYGNGPRLSYWNGCSSGGKQGLKEAQRFPLDYDGIIAGAPGNFWTHLMTGVLSVWQATVPDSISYIPPNKYPLIHKAVLDACDSIDGVKDGVLEDPRRCQFDPRDQQCKDGGDGSTCLTAPQVEAVRKIYAGVNTPRTGQQLYPGLEPGSELGWAFLAMFKNPGIEHFKYLVFKNPDWNYRTLRLDADIVLANKLDKNTINAIDPNLKKFVQRGGKLLLYHGWNDQALAPRNTVNYYNSVLSAMGGAAKVYGSVRLFMAPGMTHCGGGEGPNDFDAVGAMEQWVEKGNAPDRIIAAHHRAGQTDRTRPLCPYPQIAEYTGTGNINDAANFVCTSRNSVR
jgi:feruloyl esterase